MAYHKASENEVFLDISAVALKYPERLHSLTLCDTPFKRPTHIDKTYTLEKKIEPLHLKNLELPNGADKPCPLDSTPTGPLKSFANGI